MRLKDRKELLWQEAKLKLLREEIAQREKKFADEFNAAAHQGYLEALQLRVNKSLRDLRQRK